MIEILGAPLVTVRPGMIEALFASRDAERNLKICRMISEVACCGAFILDRQQRSQDIALTDLRRFAVDNAILRILSGRKPLI
jgi:hypothetical protein